MAKFLTQWKYSNKQLRAEFPNPDTIDIWNQITLCCGMLSCTSLWPGLYPLDTSSNPPQTHLSQIVILKNISLRILPNVPGGHYVTVIVLCLFIISFNLTTKYLFSPSYKLSEAKRDKQLAKSHTTNKCSSLYLNPHNGGLSPCSNHYHAISY